MTATWRDVARKDFEDAVRSRLLWGLTAVFIAFLSMALLSAEQLFPETATVDAAKALAGVAMLGQLFVPGIALVVGYIAVVGERRSGSLRVLLSYPFSRLGVVAGKLVGRLLVTFTALVVGYAVGSALVAALYGFPDVGTFVGFVGAGTLVGLTFTSLAVGGSAAARTRGRAMGLAVGSFTGMVFFWKPIIVGLYYAVKGSLPGVQAEAWYFFLKRLNPLEAFRVLAGWALDEDVAPVPEFPLEDVPASIPPEQLTIANRVAGEVPFYLEEWASVVVLIAWGAIPVLVGYRRFEHSDL
ncbi:MAG: ABC-2 type transport system permease protein [Halobacteriales archaeon]|jgi:ABC-2 type transport system permease protein